MAAIMRNVVNWSAQHRDGQRPSQSPPPAAIQRDMCEVCKKKPKFVERGHKHPYCSRTCAAKTIPNTNQTLHQPQGLGTTGGSSPPSSPPVPTPTLTPCLLAGCSFQGQSKFYGFCDLEHAREAVKLGQVEACEICRDQPRCTTNTSRIKVGPSRKLCAGCDRAARGGTQLRELGNKDSKFQLVRKQFIGEWTTRNEGLPTVDKVYQVLIPRDGLGRYAAYRKALKTSREIRTYHASLVVCDLGTKGPFLCERTSCGVCTVVRSSFHSFAFDEPFNEGRFGPGIYTFSNPALADRHATSCTSSPYRVMIACDLLLEAEHEVVNDESIFVETPDAINAAYIIMYSM